MTSRQFFKLLKESAYLELELMARHKETIIPTGQLILISIQNHHYRVRTKHQLIF